MKHFRCAIRGGSLREHMLSIYDVTHLFKHFFRQNSKFYVFNIDSFTTTLHSMNFNSQIRLPKLYAKTLSITKF